MTSMNTIFSCYYRSLSYRENTMAVGMNVQSAMKIYVHLSNFMYQTYQETAFQVNRIKILIVTIYIFLTKIIHFS